MLDFDGSAWWSGIPGRMDKIIGHSTLHEG